MFPSVPYDPCVCVTYSVARGCSHFAVAFIAVAVVGDDAWSPVAAPERAFDAGRTTPIPEDEATVFVKGGVKFGGGVCVREAAAVKTRKKPK